MDLDRITHPLRLAEGSHQPESGKGCAMNVISYINGDAEVTDFPVCSARPLAAFVRWCNDVLAGPDGYLSPKDSLLVLDLGWLTVGTAQVSHTVIHAWVAELLTHPIWGVVNYVESDAVEAIRDIAQLHRKVASGDAAPIAAWVAADRAAHGAARSMNATLNAAALYAVRAAYQSMAPVDADHGMTLDAVTGYALRAHALAAGGTASTRAIELARHAIYSWRNLAGLDTLDDAPHRSRPSCNEYGCWYKTPGYVSPGSPTGSSTTTSTPPTPPLPTRCTRSSTISKRPPGC
jgi:hypothetical protein